MREIIPDNIDPIKYELELTPDLKKFTFSGVITIHFKTKTELNKIILNAKELDILNSTLKYGNVTKYSLGKESVIYDKEKERVQFNLSNSIPKGKNVLFTINYTGILNDEMAGFYRSKYQNSDEYMAVTQFEATDARRALPCIDEPAKKAIFQLTLKIDKELTGLGNTPVIEEKILDDKKIIKFAESPIMSSYLLAFYVGKVDYVEDFAELKSGKKIRVRVYTPVGKSSEGYFALGLCCKVLAYFSDFFKVDYPLEKMDMIAIPDFAAGAMENWGLITYRSALVLYDEKTSKDALVRIAYVICHELAHQWFGNLVTMKWWSELWLNEGFATWVGWLAVDHTFPDWKVWDSFYLDEFCKALELDSLDNSHPIEVDIEKASQINEIFDAISYSKGACIIGMVVGFIGLENFKGGIHKYLSKYKYQNATTINLWEELGSYSDKPLIEMMANWTSKMGYPMVTIESDNNMVICSQKKFQHINNDKVVDSIWTVPLNLNINSKIYPLILNQKSNNYQIDNLGEKPIKLNNDETGFYVCNYDQDLLNRLIEPIQDQTLNIINRASIVNDLFSLTKYGYNNLDKYLNFVKKAYNNETSYVVLNIIISNLGEIKSIYYQNEDKVHKIELLEFNLIKNLISYKSQLDESFQDSLRRTMILSMMVKLYTCNKSEEMKKKQNEVIEELNKMYQENNIPADLRQVIYVNQVKNGNKNSFNKLIEKYNNTDSLLEQNQILSALGTTTDLTIINYLLNATFDLDNSLNLKVRTQDIPRVVSATSHNFKARDLTWNFVKNNWDVIYDKLSKGSFLFGRVVSGPTSLMSSEKDYKEIKEFLEGKNIKTLEKTVQQILEKIKNNIYIIN
jgi:aminopeptidase N